MEARTPIDSITDAPTAPATTISAGSDTSGTNYHPRVYAAASAADGGGSAATVTGCVGSSENAHWKYRMFGRRTTFFFLCSDWGLFAGMFDVRYFSRFWMFSNWTFTPQFLGIYFFRVLVDSEVDALNGVDDSLRAITSLNSIIITNHSGYAAHCR